LKVHESTQLLQASDLTSFACQNTGKYSSAAARNGMALGMLVLATSIPILDDLHDAASKLLGATSEGLQMASSRQLMLFDEGVYCKYK
jgi:hypothetical protein